MTGSWIALALVLAMSALGAKALRRRVAQRRLASLPGRTPQKPLQIASFSDIDQVMEDAACVCGGPIRKVGEGGTGSRRVARGVCEMCEEEMDFYFDIRAREEIALH